MVVHMMGLLDTCLPSVVDDSVDSVADMLMGSRDTSAASAGCMLLGPAGARSLVVSVRAGSRLDSSCQYIIFMILKILDN